MRALGFAGHNNRASVRRFVFAPQPKPIRSPGRPTRRNYAGNVPGHDSTSWAGADMNRTRGRRHREALTAELSDLRTTLGADDTATTTTGPAPGLFDNRDGPPVTVTMLIVDTITAAPHGPTLRAEVRAA